MFAQKEKPATAIDLDKLGGADQRKQYFLTCSETQNCIDHEFMIGIDHNKNNQIVN